MDITKQKFTYEILCVDAGGKTVTETEKNILFSLLAYGAIWKNASLREQTNTIYDDVQNLSINAKLIDTTSLIDDALKKSFLIKAKGTYEVLEPLRYTLCQYLNSQSFEYIYVLTDEISSHIACQIYPEVNKLENALRKYLMKFFVTKLGPNWWNVTADSEMKKKVDSRKRNETNFSQVVDNKAYLIDFGELGKMVYSQSSGFISKEDIIDKIMNLSDEAGALQSLKNELQSNYNKFFKETFKTRDFQKKWEDLEKIRHKIAHNNLFVDADLAAAKKLSKELWEIIDEANTKIDAVVFSPNEQELIKDSIVAESYAFKVISDSELLNKLDESELWAHTNADGFVGLVSFVKNYLGSQGYDYKATFDTIRRLTSVGKIEIYDHHSPKNTFPIKAIRRSLSLAKAEPPPRSA